MCYRIKSRAQVKQAGAEGLGSGGGGGHSTAAAGGYGGGAAAGMAGGGMGAAREG